jgi:hypothetical protein
MGLSFLRIGEQAVRRPPGLCQAYPLAEIAVTEFLILKRRYEDRVYSRLKTIDYPFRGYI